MTTRSSSVVVFNDKQEILLVPREDARVWALPAGGLEPGETFEQAAIREVREETGYNIELGQLVGKYWRSQYPKGGDRMQVFVGRAVSGDTSEHDWESIDVRWFPLDALPKRLFKFSREHIQDACAYSGKLFEREQRFSGAQAMLLGCFFALRKIRNRILHRS
jgi:8-oxo-dGTP pyrophosphatase MutT (NUDIX family)